MKAIRSQKRRRGFTVLEMTMAMALSLGVAMALIGLLQQQVSLMQVMNEFRFLKADAPQVNTLLTNIVNKSDSYRIFGSTANAKNLSNAVRSGGTALRLRFRNPDGSSAHAIVAFETIDEQSQLNYYFQEEDANSWPSSPTWTITTRPTGVTFDNSSGILLITMTGEHGDEITYAGNPQ